jgi:hypothetical protein
MELAQPFLQIALLDLTPQLANLHIATPLSTKAQALAYLALQTATIVLLQALLLLLLLATAALRDFIGALPLLLTPVLLELQTALALLELLIATLAIQDFTITRTQPTLFIANKDQLTVFQLSL